MGCERCKPVFERLQIFSPSLVPQPPLGPDGAAGSEEKLKRLFAEKHIPAEQRPLWPVALFEGRIVWVRGFPVAHDFAWTPGSGDAVRIEVLPLNPESGAT